MDFKLYNQASVGGVITSEPMHNPWSFTVGQNRKISMLSINSVLQMSPEDKKTIYTGVTFPSTFNRQASKAFIQGGNLLITGALESWVRDEGRINLSVKARAAMQKDVVANAVLTTKNPIYSNMFTVAGVVRQPEGMDEAPIKIERDGQTLFFMLNSVQKEGTREIWAPVLFDQVPDGFGDDEDIVWTVQGQITGVQMDNEQWQDCIRVDTVVASGRLEDVAGCVVDIENPDSDIPF
jgi:hypothetical protein